MRRWVVGGGGGARVLQPGQGFRASWAPGFLSREGVRSTVSP